MGSMLVPALRMLVSLGIVIALMFAAARLLRRTHGGSPVRITRTPGARASSGGPRAAMSAIFARSTAGPARRPARRRPHRLEVLARQPLGKSASVAVVRVGGRTLLVGVTDNAVQLLSEVDATAFDDGEVVASVPVAIDSVELPDTEMAAARTSISVMDVLRERTVRRA